LSLPCMNISLHPHRTRSLSHHRHHHTSTTVTPPFPVSACFIFIPHCVSKGGRRRRRLGWTRGPGTTNSSKPRRRRTPRTLRSHSTSRSRRYSIRVLCIRTRACSQHCTSRRLNEPGINVGGARTHARTHLVFFCDFSLQRHTPFCALKQTLWVQTSVLARVPFKKKTCHIFD